MRGPQCTEPTGLQEESPEGSHPTGAVAGPWWPLCLHSPQLAFARLQAGVIQLKNNLPLWGYFYLGISPLHWASTQTHMRPRAARVARPSENNRYSSWGSTNRRHYCQPAPGWDKRVTERGQPS